MVKMYTRVSFVALAIVAVLVAVSIPFVALAQGGAPADLGGFANSIITIINGTLVPLLLAIAFIAFVWGVFRYFIASTDEAKEKGRDVMIYGLIGFFVIISVWGIVNLLTDTIRLDEGPDFNLPEAESVS